MTEPTRDFFIANISHEFRTPLSSISASLEIFSDDLEHLSRSEMRELLNSIRLSVTGLQMLVDNLLDSASIEAGQFSITRRPVHLNAVLADAIHIMQPLLDRRQQTLTLLEPLFLHPLQADANRLRQVIINLLMNASKYSPQNESIDLTVESGKDGVKISVADRGAGIPESEQENIFFRFVRLDHQHEEGVGLGLAVVKTIVEGHGGHVGVQSRPGGGTIFWLKIPGEAHESAGRG
ncbi:MAG: hypothetical protein K8I82_05385 [Anaerolineae bacterium]|nr:hypothetical protein [Anaerolineae bacterium]